jgi:4-amino-4-deoxy-L-arabinose transferase-like glycosyltransferase
LPVQSGAVTNESERTRSRSRLGFFPWELLPLVALASISNFWSLTSGGWGNSYYSAAVRSMRTNWKSFLFNSFDSANYVTVDKPPLSLWVQVASTKVLGWNQFALLAPQAFVGVLAVVLLYLGVQRSWGRTAGFVAGAALSITPISVAVNHSNNTDAVLVFLMVATAVAGAEAVRRGQLRWLMLAGGLGGLAILAKMAAAVPVLPGVFLAYLLCTPHALRKRVVHSCIGVLITGGVGLSWFAAMEMVPKSSRPYIGSTQKNSAFELAFERNGVDQIGGTIAGLPTGAGPGGGPAGRGPAGGGAFPPNQVPPDQASPPPGGSAPGSLGGGAAGPLGGPGLGGANSAFAVGFAGGEPGVGRLFNSDLGTQSGWLIPLAISGALGALLIVGFRRSEKVGTLMIFSSWAVGAGVAFSITKGIVHPYYLAQIGPPIAALVGIGVGAFAHTGTRQRRYDRFLLPFGLAATALAQWIILRRVSWRSWQAPVSVGLLGIGVAIALVLVAQSFRGPTSDLNPNGAAKRMRIQRAGLVAIVAAAFLAPASWLQGSLAIGTGGPLPYATPYPTLLGSGLTGLVGQTPASETTALVQYLRANRSTEKWILGVASTREAEQIVITSGEPVMAVGGFTGTDPISTEKQLRAHISSGRIRFLLLNQNRPGPFGRGRPGGRNATNPALSQISQECAEVPRTVWNPKGSAQSPPAPGAGAALGARPILGAAQSTLYDCVVIATT